MAATMTRFDKQPQSIYPPCMSCHVTYTSSCPTNCTTSCCLVFLPQFFVNFYAWQN